MQESSRPHKVLRLRTRGAGKYKAAISVLGDPDEVRISAGGGTFLGITEDALTIAGGTPSKIVIQGMSHSMKYVGLVQDLPFPLSLVPSTPVTPLPKQLITPPFMETLASIRDMAKFAAALA